MTEAGLYLVTLLSSESTQRHIKYSRPPLSGTLLVRPPLCFRQLLYNYVLMNFVLTEVTIYPCLLLLHQTATLDPGRPLTETSEGVLDLPLYYRDNVGCGIPVS